MRNQQLIGSSLQSFSATALALLISFIANGSTFIAVNGQPTVNIAVSLTTSGTNTAGEAYSLECSVNVTGSTLNQSTITWLDAVNNPVPSGMITTTDNMSTLTFNPLTATHRGTYTCSVTVGGVAQNETVIVTVENPTIIARIDGELSSPMAGSMYSLTCIVTGSERLTDSTITYQWSKDGDSVVVADQLSQTLSFSSITFSDAGSYICQATVMSSLLNGPVTATSIAFTLPDIIPITDPPTTTTPNLVTTTTTVSPPSMDDVRLSFRGNPIANNSIVLITDIGDNRDTRILCTTDNPNCCAGSNRMGMWFFPDGSAVKSRSSAEDVYRMRSGAKSTSLTNLASVILGRRNTSAASGPTGLYRCIIPDRSGVDQTLIVGIYFSHDNMAEIVPLTNSFQLTSISAQNSANVTFSLTCNSSGGPVDSIVWMRDGSSLLDRDSASIGPLVLTDASTASYVNTLEVSSRLPGTYTCLIRGPDDEILSSMDVIVNGSAPPLNVQATRSSSSAPVEVSWSPSPSDGVKNITGYRIFYGSGQSVFVPPYVTSIIFNFVESQDEVGQSVSVRSESVQLLPSELMNAAIVTGESVSIGSVACISEMTLSVAVGVTILVTSGVTAIIVTIIVLGLCCWRKKSASGKNLDFPLSENVAYGRNQVEPEIEGTGEYVVPDELAISSHDGGSYSYEPAPVGRHSNLYDLPTSQPTSPQPAAVVYAIPHENNSRQS